jgi:alkanesulfonate monooxygenase SsuD/methylene tetrahydromethanopterin reductase-like flavin-dependent oxidoreductase (luciferase family)
MTVRVGLQIPDFNGAGGAGRLGSQLAAVARTADDAGFDSIGVMDHFFQIGNIGPP